MLVNRNQPSGLERLDPHRECRARRGAGVDLHDDVTGRGRAQFQNLALARLEDVFQGRRVYFLVSQLPF